MKKTLAILFIAAFALQSCAVIRYTEDGQQVKEQTRIFYVIGGLAPISNNKVKTGPAYETKQDFLDVVISALTGGLIYSHSVIPLSK